MYVVTCGMTHGEAETYRMMIENAGESWRVDDAAHPGDALRLMAQGAQAVILGEGSTADALVRCLTQACCTSPPYIVRACQKGLCDAAADASSAAAQLAWLEQTARLPVLCMLVLPELTCLARSLLAALSVKRSLRACAFLPDMLALCAAHPSLMDDLSGRLYPLVARRHGVRPQTIERSLRLLVESTFTGSRLDALERFFGHSVDPERGKPTNKEFLAQLQQRLMAAHARLGGG